MCFPGIVELYEKLKLIYWQHYRLYSDSEKNTFDYLLTYSYMYLIYFYSILFIVIKIVTIVKVNKK